MFTTLCTGELLRVSRGDLLGGLRGLGLHLLIELRDLLRPLRGLRGLRHLRMPSSSDQPTVGWLSFHQQWFFFFFSPRVVQ